MKWPVFCQSRIKKKRNRIETVSQLIGKWGHLVKLIKLWIPVIVWAGVIFFFSSIPDLRTDLKYDFFLRKVAHVTEYFIFTFLLYRAFKDSFSMNVLRLFMYPAVFSLLYAISDEIHQYFVIGRSCAIGDVLIDSIGIIGFFIFIKIRKGCPCLIK